MSSVNEVTDAVRETAQSVGDAVADLQTQGREAAAQAQDLAGSRSSPRRRHPDTTLYDAHCGRRAWLHLCRPAPPLAVMVKGQGVRVQAVLIDRLCVVRERTSSAFGSVRTSCSGR